MTDVRPFSSQPLLRLVALCSLPVVLSPLLEYLAVAPFGSEVFLWFHVFVVLLFLLALLVLIVAPVLLFVRRLRPLVVRALIGAAVLAAALLIGLHVGRRVRMAAFHGLAQRSAPLIQAIRQYEAKHNTPPPDLSVLVPEFLPAIPGTGMAAYPRYEYSVGENALHHFHGNPWVVSVSTPSGGINFDRFMYFPLQNYPKTGYGGYLQRIADWAYVHE